MKERRAFGQPIAAFQNTQFKLAELATEVEIGQAFVDQLLAAHVRGDDDRHRGEHGEVVDDRPPEAPHRRVPAAPRRLRLHARVPDREDYADAAVQSIYAGTNEIMKVIIARRMGLG